MSAPEFEALLRQRYSPVKPTVPTVSDREAAQARAELGERRRRVMDQVMAYNGDMRGTPVADRFLPEDARLCLNFLAFMAERGYPGIRTLRVTNPIAYEARGYNIGKLANTGFSYEIHVYLCDDERLRATRGASKGIYGRMFPTNDGEVLIGNLPVYSPDGLTIAWAGDIQAETTVEERGPDRWEPGGFAFSGTAAHSYDSSYTSTWVEGSFVQGDSTYRTVPLSLQEQLMSIAALHYTT